MAAIRRVLVLAIVMALVGCNDTSAPGASTSAPVATTAPASKLANASTEELHKRIQAALRDQRIYAPAGDNAIELYVALRDRGEGSDTTAQSALMELQPYAVIGAEQAVARGDLAEAERLRALVAATDPRAPSLERIAKAIDAARAQAEAARAQAEAAAAEPTVEPAPEVAVPEVAHTAPQAPSAPIAAAPTVAAPVTPPPPAPPCGGLRAEACSRRGSSAGQTGSSALAKTRISPGTASPWHRGTSHGFVHRAPRRQRG